MYCFALTWGHHLSWIKRHLLVSHPLMKKLQFAHFFLGNEFSKWKTNYLQRKPSKMLTNLISVYLRQKFSIWKKTIPVCSTTKALRHTKICYDTMDLHFEKTLHIMFVFHSRKRAHPLYTTLSNKSVFKRIF